LADVLLPISLSRLNKKPEETLVRIITLTYDEKHKVKRQKSLIFFFFVYLSDSEHLQQVLTGRLSA